MFYKSFQKNISRTFLLKGLAFDNDKILMEWSRNRKNYIKELRIKEGILHLQERRTIVSLSA
jgi:hypothetical protein